MKKVAILLLLAALFLSLTGSGSLLAAEDEKTTPTPTKAKTAQAGPTEKPEETPADKVEDLKDRLATKVAELRKTIPKALYGAVSATTISTITVDTQEKGVKIELLDELEVYQILKGKRTKLKTEDVKKNDKVSVFGDQDTTLDILKAKRVFIEAKDLPARYHGTVTKVDSKENTVTVKGIDGENYVIDIERTTANTTIDEAGKVIKSGFSKIEEGAFVSVLTPGVLNSNDRYSALRLLHINGPKPTPTQTPEPTQDAQTEEKEAEPTEKESS